MQLRNGKSVSKACKALQSSKTTATGTIPPSNMKYVDIVFPMGSVGRLHHSAIYDSSAAQVYRTTPQTDLGSYLFDIDTIIGCRTQKNAAEEGSANEACEFKIQWKPTVAPKSNLRSFSNAVIQETTIRSFIAGVENCEDDPELVRILWKPGWLPLAAIPSFGLIRDFWNTMEAESCFVEGR